VIAECPEHLVDQQDSVKAYVQLRKSTTRNIRSLASRGTNTQR